MRVEQLERAFLDASRALRESQSRRLRRFVARWSYCPRLGGRRHIRVCSSGSLISAAECQRQASVARHEQAIAAEQVASHSPPVGHQSLSDAVTNSICSAAGVQAMRIARTEKRQVTCLWLCKTLRPELPPCTHRWCDQRGVQPNGRVLASGSADHSIILVGCGTTGAWSPSAVTPTRWRVWRFSPNGKTLDSGAFDGTISCGV